MASLRRRDVLTGALAAGAALLGPASGRAAAPRRSQAVYLVPGYRTDVASYRGRAVMDSAALRRDFPKGFEGPGTLLTRVSEADGSVTRALLPITGHAIAVAPSGGRAVWASMNGESLLSFDPRSLALESFARPRGADYIGGGHADFTADGRQVLFVERKRYGPRPARPQEQYGQVTIRDPADLSVLERYSCHGVSPHQIRILRDGRHVAISNYGSVNAPSAGEAPEILEPSLTLLELVSGRLVEKWVGPDLRYEVRHLAADRLDRIAAVLARRVTTAEIRKVNRARPEIYEPDFSVLEEVAYMPAPVQFYDARQADTPPRASLPDRPMAARQGQSILYDPEHDEMIVSFASSHNVIVFAAASGRIRKIVRTDRLGLRYPRGLALHPDGAHYAVSGSWRGLHLFRRGSHEHTVARALHTVFFDHSHLAVA